MEIVMEHLDRKWNYYVLGESISSYLMNRKHYISPLCLLFLKENVVTVFKFSPVTRF
jgi:hypothetical protein